MKRLFAALALAVTVLIAIGSTLSQPPVAAQSGATLTFLPLMSWYPSPTPGARPLVRLSPTAGRSSGGTSYQDVVPDDVRISEVWLSYDGLVQGIQIWYLRPDGLLYTSGPHGGWGGALSKLVFDADEYIVALNGNSGRFMDSLSIVTNKRTFGPYGGSGGDTPFSIAAPAGYEIVGLFGRSGGLLDYTGALARWRQSPPPPTPVPPGIREIIRLTPATMWPESNLTYQDTVPDDGRVAEVWIRAESGWSEAMVQTVQFWYARSDGTSYSPGQRGFQVKGDLHNIVLDADEYITALNKHSGEFTDAIQVITNKRTFGFWGGDGGDSFSFVAPTGYEICGIYGSYSLGINSLGALTRVRR